MKMKNFLMLLVISVLFSCSSQAGYVLKGVFKGAGNGRAVLSVNGVNQQMISDTVEMKEGTFVFEGEVPEAVWATVVVEPEGEETVRMMLALENSRIEMRGDWNNLGMDENEELAVLGMQIIGSKNQDVYEQVEGQYKEVEGLPEFKKFAEMVKKVLEVPDGAKAEYLTRTFDETGVEVLKKAIEQDIHKFSHIPCMTDESFGGNVSGVAMEFKVLGMENITKIKTRYYKKGLRKRLRLFCGYLSLYQKNVDPKGITMVFTRSLPKNLLEISQIVANLWGKVSRRTLLSQIPFVEDVDEELNALEKETQENLENQQKMFGNDPNTKPDQPGEASAEDDVSHDEKE